MTDPSPARPSEAQIAEWKRWLDKHVHPEMFECLCVTVAPLLAEIHALQAELERTRGVVEAARALLKPMHPAIFGLALNVLRAAVAAEQRGEIGQS